YYTNYIRSGTKPDVRDVDTLADKNMADAIADVEEFADSWQGDLERLLSVIKNRLWFIYYDLASEKIVYTVFEVLNSRGLPVSWLDRTKSVLMGIAFDKADNQQEVLAELRNIWSKIYRTIGLRQGLSSEALRFTATLFYSSEASRPLNNEDALNAIRHACS